MYVVYVISSFCIITLKKILNISNYLPLISLLGKFQLTSFIYNIKINHSLIYYLVDKGVDKMITKKSENSTLKDVETVCENGKKKGKSDRLPTKVSTFKIYNEYIGISYCKQEQF